MNNDFDKNFKRMQKNGDRFVKFGIVVWAVSALAYLSLLCAAVYVVGHFIIKFW